MLGEHRIPASWAQTRPLAQVTTRAIETVTGELSPTSPLLEDDGNYYETYAFEGTAGKTLTIDFTSDDFDAYLQLQSPMGELLAPWTWEPPAPSSWAINSPIGL